MRAIAARLRMPLGLKPGENLITERTVDPALHENYLRAKNLVAGRATPQAIKLLEDVVAREPNYASAWGLMGQVYHLLILGNPAVGGGRCGEGAPHRPRESRDSENCSRKAIALDSKKVDGLRRTCPTAIQRWRLAIGDGDVSTGIGVGPRSPGGLAGL